MGGPRRAALVSVAALALAPQVCEARYGQPPCSADEVQGEVQGGSGYLCAPRCDQNFNCPSDVPYGTSAQAQCMLKDVDQSAFCGLVCQVDSQCPSGSRCRTLEQYQVGICQFPISFTDWAKSTVTRKFAVGWPNKQAGVGSLQIAKTYASLQSLKSKYSIDDGDADMVTLKEFLSSMSSSPGVSTTGGSGANSMLNSIWGPAVAPPATPTASTGTGVVGAGFPGAIGATVSQAPQPRRPNQQGNWDFAENKWMHDAQYFSNNVLFGGLTGAEREIHDTVWNIEHFEERGVCSMLLRSTLMIMAAYLCIGAAIKSQTTDARGMDLIPHIGFWVEYPAMVADGVTYAKILLGGQPQMKMSHEDLSGGLSSGPLGRGGAGSSRGVGSFDAL